jgi:ligand-binding sensor domain-containing protein
MAKDGLIFRLILIGTFIAEIAAAQVWTDYLGGRSINTVIWDSDRKQLWFATSGDGLISFDGTSFTYYTVETTRGKLITDVLTCAVLDRDGELWLGTSGQGLIRFKPDSSKWHTYTTQHGLLPNSISALAVDEDGAIWIGTNGSGVNRFNRFSRWDTLTTDDGLNGNDVRSIATDREGNRWFGTFRNFVGGFSGGGVGRLVCADSCFRAKPSGRGARLHPKAVWSYYLRTPTNQRRTVNAIHIENVEGKLHKWFATDRGVYHLLPNNVDFDPIPQTTVPIEVQGNVRGIAFDQDGNKWFGILSGAARLDLSEPDRKWKIFNDPSTLSDRTITTITPDDDGNLWFGALNRQGAVRMNANFVTYTSADGLDANTVLTLAEDNAGTIWAGTISGLAKFNHTFWKNFQFPDDTLRFIFRQRITAIAPDAVNGLWVATAAGGAVYVPPNAVPGDILTNKFYTARPGGLLSNSISDVVLFKNEPWFATVAGLSHFIPRTMQWESFTTDSGIVDNNIAALAVEKEIALWCGTLNGASRFDFKTRKFQNFTTANGLAGNWVTDILISDKADTIWFATNGDGVSLYVNGRWQKPLTTADGLASNTVAALLKSLKPAGIWFGTTNGASFLDAKGVWTTIRTEHGLGRNTLTSLLRDHQHRIWFGTQLGGVTRYTRRFFAPTIQLRTRFDVTISSEITYDFVGADIGTATRLLRYAHKLDNSAYSPWLSDPFVRLLNPPDGLHTFYAKAIDADGNESAEITDTFYKISLNRGITTSFPYRKDRALDSVIVTLYWAPNQFSQDPKISLTPLVFDSLDAATFFAFDLTALDPAVNRFKKAVTLTFALPRFDPIKAARLKIFRGAEKPPPQWNLIGGTMTTRKDTVFISTAIESLGRYGLREVGKESVAAAFAVSAQPRVFSPSGRGHGPQTTISFKLDQPEQVRIEVYNLAGRLVETIWNASMDAGVNAVAWNGKDPSGAPCPTGLYIITIESRGFQPPLQTIKVMVVNE